MSSYISDIRKLIGHQTIIQCSASIILIDDQGAILLGKRTDNGLWGYAGGSVEVDEKVEDCARRELYEEFGLIAKELEFFMINSGPEVHYIYPNGDEVSNIEIVYLCRNYYGEQTPDKNEMSEIRHFKPEEIDLEMISPPIRNVLKKFIESLKP